MLVNLQIKYCLNFECLNQIFQTGKACAYKVVPDFDCMIKFVLDIFVGHPAIISTRIKFILW